MIKRALTFCFFGVFNSVLAINIPEKSSFDPRITYATYNAHDVFRVIARNGYVSVLEFGSDEKIINTATGFSDGWDLVQKGNLLFIKPKAYVTKLVYENQNVDGTSNNVSKEYVIDPTPKTWKTNLIVITNLNSYVFDLLLSNRDTTYKLTFSYPEKELNAIKKQYEKIEKQTKQKVTQDKLNQTTIPRNWNFYMKVNKGSEDIVPSFAYDDGVFTYLSFDNTKTFPSVFLYENKKESILNTHVKKIGNYDVLVIHKIARQILLRSGDKVVGIFNGGYAKNPLAKTRETSNEDVIREIKGK